VAYYRYMAKVVLVEDDKFLSEIYQTRLQMADIDCVAAGDGMTGLALIREAKPSLVLLDLMLPEMSGDEVLRAMRESDWGKDIKVLILTNISESEAPLGLRELGIEGYIVKANLVLDRLPGIVHAIVDTQGALK
jgi:DNA-binding response OmpR family regulator